jgi:hypothetical protein
MQLRTEATSEQTDIKGNNKEFFFPASFPVGARCIMSLAGISVKKVEEAIANFLALRGDAWR